MLSGFPRQTRPCNPDAKTALEKPALEPAPDPASSWIADLGLKRMNRKQRRAAPKQSPSAGGHRAGPARDPASELFAEAARLQRENKHADAARAYKRLLLLKPDHAEASNNLGVVLLAQGKRAEASACFARSLTLMPQLFEQFNAICETLAEVLPPIGEAMRRAMREPGRTGLRPSASRTTRACDAVCDDPCCSACCSRSPPARPSSNSFSLAARRAASAPPATRPGRRRTGVLLRDGEAMLHQ